MKAHYGIRMLSVMTAFLSYIMLLMGAIVTKTGSGKGCGNSWPFCHGHLIPKWVSIEMVIEYSHRIVSGGVGFLILILTIMVWVIYPNQKRIKALSFMSLFFVVLQGMLGALTVVFEGVLAKKATLALHFGFSLISFASVILLMICLVKKESSPLFPSAGLRIGSWCLFTYTYVVVYTGAFVRHTHATMGCGYRFPMCGNTYFPDFNSLSGIQMLHRYAAVILCFFVLWFAVMILRQFPNDRAIRMAGKLSLVLITLQAISGVLVVFTGGQLVAALIHTTLISCFFSVLSYVCMEIGFRKH